MNLFEETPPTDDVSKREELLNKWKDKSPEELLKAKIDADLFIETLTKRQDDLSRDYLEMKKNADAQASLQDLVDRLNNKTTSNSDTPNAKEGTEPQGLTAEAVKALIEENKRLERQTANANLVQTKLKDRFGNSYQDVLRDTGLSQKQINEIAAESPEAIFRLVGLDNQSKETFQPPPQSATRPGFAPKTQKRDWNYYQEMKKTNPKLYLDPKIAVQMHNDAVEQGEAFYG
jgi:hypothetical protein